MSVDIFLMLKENVNVKELQNIIIEKFKDIENDIWSELNVMQLELKDGNFIDWAEMKDESAFDANDKKYIEDKGFQSVYCITYEPENLDIVLEIIKIIFENHNGILASDTDDFEPILLAKE